MAAPVSPVPARSPLPKTVLVRARQLSGFFKKKLHIVVRADVERRPGRAHTRRSAPGAMAHAAAPPGSPGGGERRPFTTPAERQPTALSVPAAGRPHTSFPATGFDAELARLESDDEILRQQAMNNLIAMAKYGGSTERVIAMMIEKLQDSDKLFRSLAVEALSRSAKQVRQEVTDALIRSLQDTDANVRCRAVKALRLACVGPSHPPVVAALAAMVRDENPFVQDAAVDNLQSDTVPLASIAWEFAGHALHPSYTSTSHSVRGAELPGTPR